MSRFPGFAEYMEEDRGFRGWLVFFFVTSAIGTLARAYLTGLALTALVKAIGSPKLSAALPWFALQTTIHVALFVASVVGLWLFAKGDRRTPTYWATLLLLTPVMQLAIAAIVAQETMLVSSIPFSEMFTAQLRNGIGGLVVSLAWTGYWIRSNRVRLTYGANAFGRLSSS